MREFSYCLDFSGGTAQTVEYFLDVGSLLHADDSELVLLIHPHQEALVVIVEDTATRWPITIEVAGFQEAVSLLEEEVVGDELLLDVLLHAFERVEGAFQISAE